MENHSLSPLPVDIHYYENIKVPLEPNVRSIDQGSMIKTTDLREYRGENREIEIFSLDTLLGIRILKLYRCEDLFLRSQF